ncbi:hypothetical protein WJX84_011423 [Apatococcus fuscideae]|uniref:AAA+ ATPase domain-containing protein n=1 Tax=Apatococcus fuscideae TaxID=2026836 RepID=A0AAW1TDD2_9CHLO
MVMVELSTAAVTLALASNFFLGKEGILEGACDRLEPYLLSQMVGQDMAIQQFSDAVCDHLNQPHPQKPLVVSAHGSPGVGKSYMHKLAARALYNQKPQLELECPGIDCPSLKVFSGLDYVSIDRAQQHAALKTALLEHLRKMPQALIVIDEYDKMDCDTQFMFKQLIQGSHNVDVSMNRAIVVLESNAGFEDLHQLLVKTRDRSKINAEEVQRLLKDIVWKRWDEGGCHDHASLWKMVGLVDFFLPFLPLEQVHLERLFQIRLGAIAASLLHSHRVNLTWAPELIPFLYKKVDFDGPYPIEGAKEASVLLTRYVSRTLRQWTTSHAQPQQGWLTLGGGLIPKALKKPQPPEHHLGLFVKGQGLVIRKNLKPP